jgi:hypothetical protein
MPRQVDVRNHSEKLKLPQKQPVGDEQRFYVKSTHTKYIMGEESSEVAKLRVIRALKDVDLLRIDRAPTYFRLPEVAPTNLHSITQECFSMPGVALRRGEYYYIVLGADQILKANKDYTYFISYKLREKLNVLHKDLNEGGVQLEKPFGTEKSVVEVHFPPTRKPNRVNKKVQLSVYEVRRSDPNNFDSELVLDEIESARFTVNAEDPIEPIPGTFTDMFRLTLLKPSQSADYIRVKWQWAAVSASPKSTENAAIRAGTPGALKVFISYSHKYLKMQEKFLDHLAPLVDDGLVEIWGDRNIEAGGNWEGEINKEIDSADIILLLVSAPFLRSRYCRKELLRAIELRGAGKSLPIPIILRDCDWHSVFNRPEYKAQALPRDNRAVAGGSWINQDAAFATIAKELRGLIEEMRSKS